MNGTSERHYSLMVENIYLQIKGSSGLLNKITFSGEDHDFLQKRQQALEVSFTVKYHYFGGLDIGGSSPDN